MRWLGLHVRRANWHLTSGQTMLEESCTFSSVPVLCLHVCLWRLRRAGGFTQHLHVSCAAALCGLGCMWIAKIAGQGLRPGLAPGSLGPALPRGDRVQPCSEGRGSAPVAGMHVEGKGWHRGKGSNDHGDDTETRGPPIDVQTGLVMDAAVAVCLTPRGRVQYHCDPNGSCCWKHAGKNKSTQYPCSVCSCIGVVSASRKLCK